jgi:hypothetical protein
MAMLQGMREKDLFKALVEEGKPVGIPHHEVGSPVNIQLFTAPMPGLRYIEV